MSADIEKGLVKTVIVKDLSRFGRNYIEVGSYSEIIYPEAGVRFIAIMDNVDTGSLESNEFAAFTNLFNEWYPKSTSKKVKEVKKAKGLAGEHLGAPPYGYLRNPDDKTRWLVDGEAAAVVRRIFSLCMQGKGVSAIATTLWKDRTLAFCGAVITYYDENSGTYSEIDVNEDGTYIAPRGQISTSDLSLSFTYSRSPAAKNTKLSYIKVTYNYNWLNLPFFRWQDPTSVSWDDSKFQMTDNSFSKVDKYDGYVIGPNGELLGPYTNQTHSSENGYANASNAGVSWYADLKGYIGVQPTKLYGSGTFKLAPKSTTTSGSTTLYGHYVHPKAELGLSVNVSSYGSFSISGGSNYDERGSQKTISW